MNNIIIDLILCIISLPVEFSLEGCALNRLALLR